MAGKKTEKSETFEQYLQQAEQVVIHLENGELPLEKAIAEYEKGVTCLKQCAGMLNQAREKVKQLIEASGEELALIDFETEMDQEEDDEEQE